MQQDIPMTIITAVVMLLVAASASAIGLRRLRFPYTIGLVLIGIAIGALAKHITLLEPIESLRLTPNVILYILLPTLVFDAAINIDARLLLKCLAPVLTLAVPGLIIATLITGTLVAWLTPLSVAAAFLFGALISATDPVAVIALFKELGAPKRLTMLVDGESLFNDATSIVAFQIILGLVGGGAWGVAIVFESGLSFMGVFLGGIVVGAIIGYLMVVAISLAKNDPLIEIAFTTIVAYTSFILANYYLEVSGVMAVVTAGMIVNFYGAVKFTEEVKTYLKQFWSYATFVANSFVFLLVGLTERDLLRSVGHYDYLAFYVLAAILAVLIARMIVIFGLVPLVNHLPNTKHINRSNQAVMFWGGLRGALPIALAVSIPLDIPGRTTIIHLTLGVVLFTLLVQGTTIGRLIRFLGLDHLSLVEQIAALQARIAAKKQAVQSIEKIREEWHASHEETKVIARQYREHLHKEEEELAKLKDAFSKNSFAQKQLLWIEAITVVQRCFTYMREGGFISGAVFRELEHTNEILKDSVRANKIPERVIPSIPLSIRFERWILHYLPFLPPTSPIKRRHRARVLTAGHERDLALIRSSLDVEDALDRLTDLSGTSKKFVDECRVFFQTRKDEAFHRMEAVAKHFPNFIGHIREETILQVGLNAERAAIDEIEADEGIPPRLAKQLKDQIDAELERIAKLEWSEVAQLDTPESPITNNQ